MINVKPTDAVFETGAANGVTLPVINNNDEGSIFNIASKETSGVDDVVNYDLRGIKCNEDDYDVNSRDCAISYSKQGGIGDCWMLSGLNAMSYTQKGQEYIKGALEYFDNGTIVRLNGAGEYWVSNEELEAAANKTKIYPFEEHPEIVVSVPSNHAKGDLDAVIFELAIEKVRKDVTDENLIFSEDSPVGSSANKEDERDRYKESFEFLDHGRSEELIYYLTGKLPEKSSYKSPKENEELLNKFIENKQVDYVLYGSLKDQLDTVDAFGEELSLSGNHAYSVKRADKNTVTVINPWDSSEELVIPRAAFVENFDVAAVDLSDNNPPQNCLQETTKEIVETGKNSRIEYTRKKDGTLYSERTIENNILKSKKEYNEKEQFIQERKYNDDGNLAETIHNSYYDNGSIRQISLTTYDTDGDTTKTVSKMYDESGKYTSKISSDYDEDGNMLNLSQRNVDDNGNDTNGYMFIYNTDGEVIKTVYYDENGNISRETDE